MRARRSSTNSLARFAGSTSASIVGSSVLPTVAFSRKRITCSGSLRLLAISKALTELPALNSFCESTRARIALAKPMPSGRFDFTCMLVPAVCGCGSPSAVAAACFSFLPATGVASDADFWASIKPFTRSKFFLSLARLASTASTLFSSSSLVVRFSPAALVRIASIFACSALMVASIAAFCSVKFIS